MWFLDEVIRPPCGRAVEEKLGQTLCHIKTAWPLMTIVVFLPPRNASNQVERSLSSFEEIDPASTNEPSRERRGSGSLASERFNSVSSSLEEILPRRQRRNSFPINNSWALLGREMDPKINPISSLLGGTPFWSSVMRAPILSGVISTPSPFCLENTLKLYCLIRNVLSNF